MQNNNSDFLLDNVMLKQVVYMSLTIGNILFVLLHATTAELTLLMPLLLCIGEMVDLQESW